MAGADGRTPEIRPPSFKGMMRFWWRAMRAEDIETLAKDEAELFGGTGEVQGKSKVGLKIFGPKLKINSFPPLPHKHTQFSFNGFEPNQSFKCLLILRNTNSQQNKKILDTFKLSLLLGGLGKRSRRGFGSISYKIFKKHEEIIKELEDISTTINKNKALKQSNYHNDDAIVAEREINLSDPRYSYPRIQRVYIGMHQSTSYEDLLKKIGSASHDHRDNALGAINPRRMASPIVATAVKVNKHFYPIITELTSHFPEGYQYNIVKQDNFIRGALHNEQKRGF